MELAPPNDARQKIFSQQIVLLIENPAKTCGIEPGRELKQANRFDGRAGNHDNFSFGYPLAAGWVNIADLGDAGAVARELYHGAIGINAQVGLTVNGGKKGVPGAGLEAERIAETVDITGLDVVRHGNHRPAVGT